jgi:hypothetical protein
VLTPVEQALEDGVQAARADVLESFVSQRGETRELLHRFGLPFDRHAFGGEQRLILPRERVLRLREDTHEVFVGERFELHANRKAPL